MNNFLESDWVNLIILVVQAGIVKFAYNLYKEYKKEQEEKDKKAQNIDGAIRGLLRVEIINICHNAEKEGFLPIWALENLTDMYNTYKALGGNGAITGLYNKTIQLPQRKEDG